MNQRGLYDNILLVIKGLAMGVANKVPGVSGGIIAVVTGFYGEFLYSLKRLNFKALMLLLTGRFRSFIQYTNMAFLSLITLGIVISYFTVSRLLDFALIHYEQHVWGLFFGMVLMSAVLLIRDFGRWNFRYLLFCALGFATGVLLIFLEPAEENRNLLFVFFCGMVSIIGMTLPGLSGSFLLILMGNYVLLLVDAVNALGAFGIGLTQSIPLTELYSTHKELLNILLVFILGSLTGLVAISSLLHYVLMRYEKRLSTLIIGFIIGSLPILWPWSEHRTIKSTLGETTRTVVLEQGTMYTIMWLVLGGVLVFGLDFYERKK
ncbi:MAG: DUF368 domain-containing protein [Flavobacteriaceae bacterium]